MLGANLLGRGQVGLDEGLAYFLLYGLDLLHLTGVDDRDGGAFLAGTASTSAAVGVVFDILGQAIVDDMCEVVHIQSAGSHISGHEQLCEVLAEFLHRQVTLLL